MPTIRTFQKAVHHLKEPITYAAYLGTMVKVLKSSVSQPLLFEDLLLVTRVRKFISLY